MKGLFIFPVLLLFLFGTPTFSTDYAHGLDAWKVEDYATAFKVWKLLAEQGDAEAQWLERATDE